MKSQPSVDIRSFYDEVPFGGDVIDSIKQTFKQQGETLLDLAATFNKAQYKLALSLMIQCKGHVIICGMGKSGHVGRKISATLASTGTPSFFVHPAEAFHGDLGMITPDDVVVLISNSGETDEVLKLIPSLKNFGNRIIAITGGMKSTLAKNADAVLEIKMQGESCPNNLAPTTSTTLTMAIGDALASALMNKRNFMPNDFARFHPGGSLGRRLLTRLKDVMSTNLTKVNKTTSLKEVIVGMTKDQHGIALVMEGETLIGVITDGDLRRAMTRQDFNLDTFQAQDIMTRSPITAPMHAMLSDAEELMRNHQIKQLLILNNNSQPVGILDFFN
ncbi:KpsF/GutQ family sugar-phosphate isomerase [Aeromonas veronii]|uniref:KpsF/GutQ family sugar-phosphate isomerase n=2 Tax=Aeromonas TaxID=642 RepID=UPI000E1EA84E|nr:KpsF/GutQ family sugar-phosphate isomerase [Aeromonas veronii]MCF5849262.1 KpsF/GutQ family sugar-phosphate isomerase [Aeromonas veronii]RDU79173.1 KpsF/GutQ family sugar-phosphate isomerase [Aeromonas veronii]RDU94123.1 KpsF/GutQ family sugar-phosphate isomerase [Aeromonas veronii]TEY62382.1 KpsF/GutQ family sugar-phosphate isomerase [Aeromonas veronii]